MPAIPNCVRFLWFCGKPFNATPHQNVRFQLPNERLFASDAVLEKSVEKSCFGFPSSRAGGQGHSAQILILSGTDADPASLTILGEV